MTIDWLAFVTVFVAALVAACAVVALFATGIRLLATPAQGATATGEDRDDEMDHAPAGRHPLATVGAWLVFVLAGLVVLVGIWLIVPAFHG